MCARGVPRAGGAKERFQNSPASEKFVPEHNAGLTSPYRAYVTEACTILSKYGKDASGTDGTLSPRKRILEPVLVQVSHDTLLPHPLALPPEGSRVERSHCALPPGAALVRGGRLLFEVSTFAFQLWIPRESL